MHSHWRDDMLLSSKQAPFHKTTCPAANRRVILKAGVSDLDEMHVRGAPLEYWRINNSTFYFPREPLTYSRFFQGNTNDVDNPLYINVELNEVIEVVIFNDNLQQHPWHLHGFDAYVIGSYIIEPQISLENRNLINR